MKRCIKDPLLEKYLAGAATADEASRIDQVLAASPDDARRLQELRAESEAFLLQYPPAAFVARAVAEPVRHWRRPLLWLPHAAGAVAGLSILVLAPRPDPSEGSVPTELSDRTVKGALTLALHRKTTEGSTPVGDGHALRPGDVLRFEVRSGAPGFVAVYGRDPKGVSLLAPLDAAPRATQGLVTLDEAVALDDAPGPEAFVAVWSPRSFDLEAVRRALEAGRSAGGAADGALTTERTLAKSQGAR